MKNIKLLFAVGFLVALLMACSSNDEVTQPEETEPEKEEIYDEVEDVQGEEEVEDSQEGADSTDGEVVVDDFTKQYFENERFVELFESLNASAFSDFEGDYEVVGKYGVIEKVEKDGQEALLHSFTVESYEGEGTLFLEVSIERFFEEIEDGTDFRVIEVTTNMDVYDAETKEKLN
ncbi:hypothetical protein AJ85_15650 [Alkalihalobacillus alcalophilus ATCC 27647 = CGMCC 1.3604]|uniref:Uncharacterized protein n=2 Tax=Alkalihalobacillus alcalophilus TaxID=1445 RepID=A0A094WIA7_ALKAL|nr:hypothetical protein [Alkalihalobacillus alcalophilus]KGA95638.1 hypothetical protein BALCAV_0221150 [Alkalihalobacillus alcalophilus ATCC 27647 = CGMCC 1.3604]MED1563991.1 hypothetical protein [Alkalihalobacillus alcalophilus]THG92214.1 hypothetical protein AJ85_15650 [Alkalihalobacillus alcalophilus ATCC 27647 = CGMCC 1.3604]